MKLSHVMVANCLRLKKNIHVSIVILFRWRMCVSHGEKACVVRFNTSVPFKTTLDDEREQRTIANMKSAAD